MSERARGERLGALAAAALALVLWAMPAVAGEADESRLLTNVRQLTFEGRRAGEGYFSRDGRQLVFQSEREPGNPFYQIYLMDLETGDVRRVSPGVGKTTCAWIHPKGDRVLFASTHRDPAARAKQRDELAKRAAGKSRRYSWSFDENYDIYEVRLADGAMRNLTDARGYDAEGSWSPDGRRILFASNRHAYRETLDEAERGILARDPSYFMDLYVMDADGGNVRRLTDAPGYDGGPFFSADGRRIVWRRFAPDGATAEVYTMNADGSGVRQVTRLGAMSWAPYFHPSGDYIVFATSLQGFGNFELYIVDAEGRSEPVRVTTTEGFDGLPVFSPDGGRLSWTSGRAPDGSVQIFIADWNDAAARRLLGLAGKAGARPDAAGAAGAATPVPDTDPAITADDLRRHVSVLASPEMEGRLTATPGGRRAGAYVASMFRALGLAPAGDDGGYFQSFEFTAGVALGPRNGLDLRFDQGGAAPPAEPDRDWRPLAFSRTGAVPAGGVVFVGYGIVAPAGDGAAAYDSYGGLDVRGKWALMLRYLPEDVDPAVRRRLYHYAELQYKAAAARDRGARGIIVASGPNSRVKDELVPLAFDAGMAADGIAAISVTDRLAAALLTPAGRGLAEVQTALDAGDPLPGFALPGVTLGATIDIVRERRTGRNVLGRLAAGAEAAAGTVVIGAHFDHLGRGIPGKSLSGRDETGRVHPGADDNASGVAGLLEIAELLADRKASGRFRPVRDILFAAWSGEELGALGSSHFVRAFGAGGESLRPGIAAYLNMDMIGRLGDRLTLHGVGSSRLWPREIERRNAPVGLAIAVSDDNYPATDALPFYLGGVPILSAFSGVHGDYHSPRDTPDKLNYEGTKRIARFMALVARSLALAETAPDYVRTEGAGKRRRRTSRVFLGTIPDYAASGAGGVRISGLAKDGPAEKAGLEPGDVVVGLAGKAIATMYDYSYALDALKIGEPAEIVVERGGRRVRLTITPAARE